MRSGSLTAGRRTLTTRLAETAAQRLAACDQAVTAVGRREERQEGERFGATVTDAATNPDPTMVCIMSLLAPAAVTDYGILCTNWQRRRVTSTPISAQSVSRLYCAAESEINRIVTVGLRLRCWPFARSELAGGTFTSRIKSDWKRITLFVLTISTATD
jgi:hypothetical protein